MNQGARCVRYMEKSGGQKSRATVPLSQGYVLKVGRLHMYVMDFVRVIKCGNFGRGG